MKIFGLPVQFVTVVVVSVAITIYLLAAVADSRVEARVADGGAPLALGDSLTAGIAGQSGSERTYESDISENASGDVEPWEHAFLLVCPLH